MEVSPIAPLNLKNGERKDRQSITIADESGVSISITVWGDLCHKLNAQPGQVVVFKQCRVSDYNGKSLNASSTPSDIILNVQHPRTAQIKKWYSSQSHEQIQKKIVSLTEAAGEARQDAMFSIQEIELAAENNSELKQGQKSAWYKMNCHIQWFPEDNAAKPMYYHACQVCKKKVMPEQNGFRCENC